MLISPGHKERDKEFTVPKSRCLPSLGTAPYLAWQALEFDWSEAAPNSGIICVPSMAKNSMSGLQSPRSSGIHGKTQETSGGGDVTLGNRMGPGMVAKVSQLFPLHRILRKNIRHFHHFIPWICCCLFPALIPNNSLFLQLDFGMGSGDSFPLFSAWLCH